MINMDLFIKNKNPNIRIAFLEQTKEIFQDEIYRSDYVAINPGDIVIDCGANLGIFSLYAISKQAKNVIAYEPNRGIWPYLTMALNNYPQAKYYPYALSNIETYREFVECYCPSASHLTFPNMEINKNSYFKDSYYVKTVPLDLHHDKADFIKIDVEGAALEVLQGAQNLIRNNKPKMAIACYHYPQEEIMITAFIRILCSDYNFEQKNGVLFVW